MKTGAPGATSPLPHHVYSPWYVAPTGATSVGLDRIGEKRRKGIAPRRRTRPPLDALVDRDHGIRPVDVTVPITLEILNSAGKPVAQVDGLLGYALANRARQWSIPAKQGATGPVKIRALVNGDTLTVSPR